MTHISKRIQDLPTTARDMADLFIGKELGSGMSRTTYEFELDPTCVVKVELDGGRFQNILEWEIWQTVRYTKWKKYFAPCLHISSNGHILIQKKVEFMPQNKYPKKIPHFFMDVKYENFGIFEGRLVACDYGTAHISAINKFLSVKLKKAEWK